MLINITMISDRITDFLNHHHWFREFLATYVAFPPANSSSVALYLQVKLCFLSVFITFEQGSPLISVEMLFWVGFHPSFFNRCPNYIRMSCLNPIQNSTWQVHRCPNPRIVNSILRIEFVTCIISPFNSNIVNFFYQFFRNSKSKVQTMWHSTF